METGKILEELFLSLKNKLEEEQQYLKNNREIDINITKQLTVDKRIIQDKIEKLNANPDELDNISKLRLQNLIGMVLKIEEENIEIYNNKLEGIKKEIVNLDKERKLKKSYF